MLPEGVGEPPVDILALARGEPSNLLLQLEQPRVIRLRQAGDYQRKTVYGEVLPARAIEPVAAIEQLQQRALIRVRVVAQRQSLDSRAAHRRRLGRVLCVREQRRDERVVAAVVGKAPSLLANSAAWGREQFAHGG